MSLILSHDELHALTGYSAPTRQLEVLHKRGFYRACIGRTGVVLTRAHFEAIEQEQPNRPPALKQGNYSHLRTA